MSEGEKFKCDECGERDKVVRGCGGGRKWSIGPYHDRKRGRGCLDGCPQKLMTDPDVLASLSLWGLYKRFGWPYAGGWAEQSCRMVDIVTACEEEQGAIDFARLEKARDKH